MRYWTKQESEIVRAFVRENPTVKLNTTKLPPILRENLPGRTTEAVYHYWRKVMGFKRRKARIPLRQIQDEKQQPFFDEMAQLRAELNRYYKLIDILIDKLGK